MHIKLKYCIRSHNLKTVESLKNVAALLIVFFYVLERWGIVEME